MIRLIDDEIPDGIKDLQRLTALLNDREEKLREERDKLSLVNEIITIANKADSNTSLLDSVLSTIVEKMDFDGGIVHLVNPTKRVAKLISSCNIIPSIVEKYKVINIDEPPYDSLFDDRIPSIIVENIQIKNPQLYKSYGILMLCIYPIVSPCGVVGSMLLFSKSLPTMTTRDVDILSTISVHIGDTLRRIWAERGMMKECNNYRELYTLVRSLCDNIPDLVWAKDLDGKYVFVNKAICNKLLVVDNTSDPIGHDDMYFANHQRDEHPDNPKWHTFGEVCYDSDRLTLESNHPMIFEEHGFVKGKGLILEVFKAPFVDDDGKIRGVVGCGRDITERRKQENDLEMAIMDNAIKATELDAMNDSLLSHECEMSNDIITLVEIINSFTSPVIWRDFEGNIKGCNNSYAKFMDLDPLHIVGKNLRNLYPPEDVDIYLSSDDEVKRKGRILIRHIVVNKNRPTSCMMHKSLYKDINGNPIGVVIHIFPEVSI